MEWYRHFRYEAALAEKLTNQLLLTDQKSSITLRWLR